MKLTLSVRSFQVPATPFTWAWPPSFPSVPTSRATRVTSEANVESWSTIVFTIFAVSRNSRVGGPTLISRGSGDGREADGRTSMAYQPEVSYQHTMILA